MAAGDFLQGLSEGIFERLGEIRKEQEGKDEAQKRNSIAVLSKAYESAEPGGQQEILRLMGDVIGVKGKMKGFWNAFSGLPDRTVEDQLGTTMRDFSSKLVAPETAYKARAGGDLARLFQPQTPEQQANRAKRFQTEQDLQGKIIFRDPREEEIRKIKARGEVAEQVQAERQATQAYYQGLRQEDAQSHAEAMKKLTESLRAKRKLSAEAEEIAFLNGHTQPDQDDYERAARNLQVRGQLDDDAKRELIEFRRAATEEKRFNVANQKTNKGVKPGEARRLGIAERAEVNRIQKAHGESLGKYTKAKGEEEAIIKQMNVTAGKYFGGSKFNPQTQLFEGGNAAGATLLNTKLLEEYRKKKGEREAAEKETSGFYNQSSRKEYAPYLKRGGSFTDPIEVVTDPVPPTKGDLNSVRTKSKVPGAQKPAPALGPLDKIMRVPNPNDYKNGEIVPMKDGKLWSVTGRGADHIRLTPVFK